jgi:aminoglycoside 6'-N-acetyltransferase
MPARLTLRAAREDDAAFLERWDKDPDVIASHCVEAEEDAVWRDEDWREEIAAAHSWRRILIAEEAGRPVGVIVSIDPATEPTHYWGDCTSNLRAFDTWIGEARDRGRGLGAEMMRLAVADAFADPKVEAIIIDPLESNRRAIKFYERQGFSVVERRRFGDDECPVMRLDRPS